MAFQKGDIVKFLNETGTATILEIEGDEALVEDEDGFEQRYPLDQLLLSKRLEVKQVQSKDEVPVRPPSIPPKASGIDQLEIDLHIGSLLDFVGGLSNSDMLNIQLREARKTLERAKVSGIKRVILIHGVGEGILRHALYQLLDEYGVKTYYDADFSKYGQGATEVIL